MLQKTKSRPYAACAHTGTKETPLTIEYICPACGWAWTDKWPSAVDGQCPNCGAEEIAPATWFVGDGQYEIPQRERELIPRKET